jgi:hypothetical protein
VHCRKHQGEQAPQQCSHGKHLPQARQPAMLEERAGSSRAMIEILASQRTEIGARIVGNCSLGIQINAPTRFDQAFVEFRIFVVREGLIIAAKLEEDLAIERRMMAVLNEPGASLLFCAAAMARSMQVDPSARIGTTTDATCCCASVRMHRSTNSAGSRHDNPPATNRARARRQAWRPGLRPPTEFSCRCESNVRGDLRSQSPARSHAFGPCCLRPTPAARTRSRSSMV